MSKPRFLCDEDQPPALIAAMRQLMPLVDVIRVGDPGAPPSGTLDPDLLIAAEAMGRVLISGDRQTMPGHLMNHFASGRHTAGVILLRKGFPKGFSPGQYAKEVEKIWSTTTADDWIDRIVYLP